LAPLEPTTPLLSNAPMTRRAMNRNGRTRVNATSHVVRLRCARARMMVIAVILSVSVLGVPDRAVAHPADDAGVSVALLNEARWAAGLDGLTPDRELQVIANRHANRMAEAGYVFHSRLDAQLSWGWWAWADNVGYGPSVWWLHSAFMDSPSHAGNILNPSYNYVGVGVAYGGDGTVYVAQVFGAW
jgi:hypothetical protein